mgnify:CR=1 FL=1
MLLSRLAMGGRRRTQAAALTSAARTATTQSADISAIGYKGVIVMLNITVASGTGGLQVRVRYKDTVSSSYILVSASASSFTTVLTVNHQYGEGIGGNSNATLGNGGVGSGYLTDTIRIEIFHADASSYTYNVNYVLVS